jgi:hypothetical protein
VTLTVAVCTAPVADVATKVIFLTPVCAKAEAVSRTDPLPTAGFRIVGGVNVAVTPKGKPVAVMVSGPVNPFVTAVEKGTSTLPFRTSDAVAFAVTVKPLTISVTVDVCDAPPPAPVTVIG